jgi:hypothetical protein
LTVEIDGRYQRRGREGRSLGRRAVRYAYCPVLTLAAGLLRFAKEGTTYWKDGTKDVAAPPSGIPSVEAATHAPFSWVPRSCRPCVYCAA